MKQRIHSTLEHPVILYGFLGALDGTSTHQEAIRQWKLNFVSSLDGESDDDFTYNQVVLLRNVNVRPYIRIPANGKELPIEDLPIFHAGVVFMKDKRPNWLYLFEHNEDMDQMMEQYPFDDFILKNDERYIDAAREAGIRFIIYDGKKKAEYTPAEYWQTLVNKSRQTQDEAVEVLDVSGSPLEPFKRGELLSLPGWPDEALRSSYQADMQQLAEQPIELSAELQATCGVQYDSAELHIMYVIPLPEIDFVIHHIAAASFSDGEGGGTIILVQNDKIFDYEINGYDQ